MNGDYKIRRGKIRIESFEWEQKGKSQLEQINKTVFSSTQFKKENINNNENKTKNQANNMKKFFYKI